MKLDPTISSLRDKGHRITKVRKQTVKIFAETKKPLSAKQVEKRLSSLGLDVNKTTVYREIQFLLQNDFLKEVFLSPKEISYESAKQEHHHHLVCERCGYIDSVANCLIEGIESDVYEKKGFRIKRHTLEFYGFCWQCAGGN